MFLKSISDIKISGELIAIERKLDCSASKLEKQIEDLHTTSEGALRDKEVENAKFPPFVQVFYFKFFQQLILPSEDQLIYEYYKWLGINSKAEWFEWEHQTFSRKGLEARIKRTYPSLLRDIHFLFLLKESEIFEDVNYSMKKDYYNGLDLSLKYRGKLYHASVFIDTMRGSHYKNRKRYRHDYQDVCEVELAVAFDSLTLVGNIYLLNRDHIALLKDLIETKFFG